ncbi:MAG: carboxymuconolactone decarboxylase family protein [Rhodobacteraceae bacterium]|nr:carboxymuconolactone decarboxylase family protein [Paracoccaceae bacterium]
MDWKKRLDDTSAALNTFRKARPETGKGFTTLHHAAMGEGSMTVREKELVALGIGIAQQCEDCIGFHLQAAVRAGATREDVADTISVAVMMGGGPSYMYGARALQAYDQLFGES